MWRILGISALIYSMVLNNLVNGDPKVECYFIFGDSSSDAGNNNGFTTMAKANYPPYGLDFARHIPTGRFTNGLTIIDFITQLLGFQRFITPYSNQMGQDILRGVNFASGAAGILPQTSSHLGNRIWMDRQIQNYMITISKIEAMVQGPVANYLNKCLYTVNMGTNDYINNYFMPQYYPTRYLYNPHQFSTLLVARYKAQLQVLYNSGARKVAIFGVGQLGCIPAEIAMNNATQCVQQINQAVELFNSKLISLVDYFNARLPGANFTFINFYAMQSLAPLPPGIITNSTCCKLRSDFQCEAFSEACGNRNLYAFMDGFHPTQIVNQIGATFAFNSPVPAFVHPVDISRLINT
ncbi:unnamed protein product [Amaranthus hypochondriacus]